MGAVLSAASPRTLWDVVPPTIIIGTMGFTEDLFQSIIKCLPSVELRRKLRLIPREGELQEGDDDSADSSEAAPPKSYIRSKSMVSFHQQK